jgi:hypothetical protein
VDEALSLPAGSAFTGRPMALLTVVATVQDRRQQAEATHAYWRLAEAIAEYRFCTDRDQQLSRLTARADEAAALRAAIAASAAAAKEAELSVLAAQHDLGARMLLPAESPLPLPADRPHAGSYRTYFAELFAARSAPERARLVERLLPIRQRAVEGHAAAVQAAEDALAAGIDSQGAREGRLATVLACVDEHFRQRRSWMAAVCRYNHDIADYALAVAAPGTTAEALVAMMIKVNRESGPPAATSEERAGQPTSYQQVVPDSPANPIVPGKNWPTRAVRTKPAPAANPSSAAPAAPNESGTTREALRPVTEGGPASALDAGLVGLPAAERAKQLVATLHANQTLSQGTGQSLSFEDFLRASPGSDRREMAATYWIARQRAAEHQAVVRQAQWLEALAPTLLERGAEAAGPMLQLRTARLGAQAAQADAEAALVESQFNLASRMGKAAEAAWPLPSSVPVVAGAPAVQQPVRSWQSRRLNAVLPGLEESVSQRATAVVEADAARAAATAAFHAGACPVDRVLTSVAAQSEQTLAFLHSLTSFNVALGHSPTP